MHHRKLKACKIALSNTLSNKGEHVKPVTCSGLSCWCEAILETDEWASFSWEHDADSGLQRARGVKPLANQHRVTPSGRSIRLRMICHTIPIAPWTLGGGFNKNNIALIRIKTKVMVR